MPYPYFTEASVHRGFYEIWTGINDTVSALVLDALSNGCSDCTNIVVTGHSLGGAIVRHSMPSDFQ